MRARSYLVSVLGQDQARGYGGRGLRVHMWVQGARVQLSVLASDERAELILRGEGNRELTAIG